MGMWQKGCQEPFSRIKELVNTFSKLMAPDFPLKNPIIFLLTTNPTQCYQYALRERRIDHEKVSSYGYGGHLDVGLHHHGGNGPRKGKSGEGKNGTGRGEDESGEGKKGGADY